jgi:hypothetical protein
MPNLFSIRPVEILVRSASTSGLTRIATGALVPSFPASSFMRSSSAAFDVETINPLPQCQFDFGSSFPTPAKVQEAAAPLPLHPEELAAGNDVEGGSLLAKLQHREVRHAFTA